MNRHITEFSGAYTIICIYCIYKLADKIIGSLEVFSNIYLGSDCHNFLKNGGFEDFLFWIKKQINIF